MISQQAENQHKPELKHDCYELTPLWRQSDIAKSLIGDQKMTIEECCTRILKLEAKIRHLEEKLDELGTALSSEDFGWAGYVLGQISSVSIHHEVYSDE